MKHFAQIFLIFFILLGAYTIVNPVSAAGFNLLTRPFGGRVIMSMLPGVTCGGGTGPVTIMPAGTSPAASYYFPYGLNIPPSPGRWVLGNYSLLSFPTCYTDTTPPSPYPTLRVTLYGISPF